MHDLFNVQSYYKRRAELYARQNQLASRGAASTILLIITAAQGDLWAQYTLYIVYLHYSIPVGRFIRRLSSF